MSSQSALSINLLPCIPSDPTASDYPKLLSFLHLLQPASLTLSIPETLLKAADQRCVFVYTQKTGEVAVIRQR